MRRYLALFILIAVFASVLYGCGGGEVSDTVSDAQSAFESDDASVPDVDESKDDNSISEEYGEVKVFFDSSHLENYASPFLESYAPFALYDTTLFADTVITSISFPFASLAIGYSVDSEGLIMPVYVIKTDFSTKREDCTVENGKKIELDFTGKLSDVKAGDWLTVDGLEIKVGANETLAFGDVDMAVLPMFLRDNGTYGFFNKVFDGKGQNNHSLIFKIEGRSLKKDTQGDTDDGETYISFLGDSISTYAGWSNNTSYNISLGANAVWYPNNDYAGANMDVTQTWWSRVYTSLGYKLAVNNSWSGSIVTDAQTYNVRAKNLHNTTSGKRPDIVVILMGVNDFAAGVEVGSFDGTTDAPANPTTFSEAYGRLITNIKTTYDGVKVYCCTFLPDMKRLSALENGNGTTIGEFNNAIRSVAENMGAEVIELNAGIEITVENISKYTVDRLHPNADGMKLIADMIIEAIK